MSFRSHFDMLSLNEPVTHKAKFWQSYVRALKGTEDMRADERNRDLLRPSRAMSEFPDWMKVGSSPFDTAGDANLRIHSPGYRYNPVSRETYGYGPRSVHVDSSSPKYMPRPFRESSLPPVLPSSMDDAVEDLKAPLDRSTRAPSVFDRPSDYDLLLNPPASMPISAVTRDPWWHRSPYLWGTSDITGYYNPYRPYSYYNTGSATRPYAYSTSPSYVYNSTPYYYSNRPYFYSSYRPYYSPPSYMRNSYLSPIRSNYVWNSHPLRRY